MAWPLKLTPNPNPTPPPKAETSSSTETPTSSASASTPSPATTQSSAQPTPKKHLHWHPRIDENLKSGWDTGTRDLYALKRRLDLTYNLREESYTIEFLRAKLRGWGRKV